MKRLSVACLLLFVAVGAGQQDRAKDIEAEIAKLKDRIAELEKELATIPQKESFAGKRIYVDRFGIGDKGVVSYPSNVSDLGRQPIRATVDEVIDAGNMIISWRWKETKYAWLKAPTKNLVDDQEITLTEPVHVSGTKKHNGKTLLYLETIK